MGLGGPLAQPVEQLTLNQPVLGSSPRRLSQTSACWMTGFNNLLAPTTLRAMLGTNSFADNRANLTSLSCGTSNLFCALGIPHYPAILVISVLAVSSIAAPARHSRVS